MSYSQAIRSSFSKYFQFSGRASRSEYWKFVAFLIAVHIVLIIIAGVLFGPTVQQEVRTVIDESGASSVVPSYKRVYDGGYLGTLFLFATFLPGLSASWRRMHDASRSGWWLIARYGIFFFGIVTAIVSQIGFAAFFEGLAQTGQVQIQGGSSTLMLMVILASFASFLMLLVALASRSTLNENKFGPVPHEVAPDHGAPEVFQ